MRKNQTLNLSTNIIFTLIILAIFNLSVSAQTPSDLDPDFFSGRVLTRLIINEQTTSTAIQADGKIVVAGYTINGANNADFFVARYTTDGMLDTTFGGVGWNTVNFSSGSNDYSPDVAIAPDGRIVLAGRTCANPCTTPQVAVARFTTAGFPDTTFAGTGRQTAFTGNQSYGYAVAVQSDGKIVVAGGAAGTGVAGNPTDSAGNTAIFRFTTGGALDPTFDGDGIVTTDFFPANQSSSSMNTVAIQPDGKIVVGGDSNSPSGSPGSVNFALARYNTDGSLDNTFSGDGRFVFDISGSSDHLYDLAIQGNGKIAATGDAYNFVGGSYEAAVVQINTDGTLDSSFGTNGITTTNIGGHDYGYTIAAQSDGKVVVAGVHNDTSNRFVARYNVNGTLDTSFDGDGVNSSILFLSYEPSQSFRGSALQSDGKVVVVGTSSSQQIAVARLKTDGTLDGTFGNRAIARTEGNEQIKSLAVQADGKIVAAGFSIASSNRDFMVKRFTANGLLDMSFALSGTRSIGFGNTSGGSPTSDSAESVKIQADGKIVLAGSGADGFCQIARLDTNGNLDNTFSGDGLMRFQNGTNVTTYCNDLAIQSDGRIAVIGSYGGNNFYVARISSNGSSIEIISPAPTVISGIGLALAIQSDGKIIAAGMGAGFSTSTDLKLIRFNTNGSLDTTFSGDGILQTGNFVSNSYVELSIAIQSDGKIVAGFPTDLTPLTTADLDFGVVRLNTDGSFDNSFGTDGLATTDFGSTLDMLSGIGIQSTGKIVATGTLPLLGSNANFAMARYNADGTLDTSFDLVGEDFDFSKIFENNQNDSSFLIGDGKVITDVGGSNDYAYAGLVQPDDKIIVGGFSTVANGNAFSLARYRGSFTPTAANADISGRVTDDFGNGLSGIKVSLRIGKTGELRTLTTNSFGHFNFEELAVGDVYIVSAADSKRYVFEENIRVVQLFDNVTDVNFVGNAR